MADVARDLFSTAAQAFLAEEAHRLPDFRHCTVLVPHFHAAAPFLAALRGQLAAPVILPPRVLTLTALADSVPGDTPAEPDSLRLAQIQTVLARSGLLPTAALWPAAQELLRLLDELSRHLLSPPPDFASFRRQCAAAYGRRLGQALERESRLVFDLWYAMQQGERPDAVADYARRLARSAERAAGPLYCLGLTGLSRLEEHFLESWAERHAVHVLPEPAGYPGRRACLEAVWDAKDEQALPERARALRAQLPDSPLRGGLRLLAAHSLEDEAQGAARAIHAWVARGVERIGIVALDRMAARRLRALLERHQVLLQDETGWTFSTAAVSHVPDRLCALAADDCYYLDLLDLLKSPFVFADLDVGARLTAVAELEAAIRAAGVPQGLARFQRLAAEQAPAALPLLQRLAAALGRLDARRDTLAGWLGRLFEALDGIGARQGMQADVAGGQLWRLLRELADDIAPHATPYGFADWRGWLLRRMEEATFLDAGIDSPARLTHLGAARLRDFQAVILLGADASHLPGAPTPGLFNEALRAELGLPGEARRQRDLRQHLADLIGQTPEVLITWQASQDGDPNPLSPWLELLDALHRVAWGDSLKSEAEAQARPAVGAGTALPGPTLDRLPATLSASAWQSLVACPYQFWARYGLALREQEEVPESPEKRDYGERVHAILRAFHEQHPRLAGHDRESLVSSLEALSRARFAALLEAHYLARAWLARWLRQVPGYVDWALQWEAAGHAWQAAEQACRVELEFAPGRALGLVGRVDRLDRLGAEPSGHAVLDYKTQTGDILRRKLKSPGEDVQLPFYALLTGATEAAFVALDDKQARAFAWPGDVARAAAAESERIAATWRALDAGARLPAQGAAHTCQWCEMRGLCRRDYWSGVADNGDVD